MTETVRFSFIVGRSLEWHWSEGMYNPSSWLEQVWCYTVIGWCCVHSWLHERIISLSGPDLFRWALYRDCELPSQRDSRPEKDSIQGHFSFLPLKFEGATWQGLSWLLASMSWQPARKCLSFSLKILKLLKFFASSLWNIYCKGLLVNISGFETMSVSVTYFLLPLSSPFFLLYLKLKKKKS